MKLYMVSLGCAKNKVDSEMILGVLKNNFDLVETPEESDLIIVNTCAFIESARKEAIDTRNDADAMVFQTEKALEEVKDQISPDEKATVEADLAHLKELIEKSNPEVMSDGEVEDIKAAKEKLMTSAQNVFQKMYEKAGAAAGAGQAGPNMGGFAGGDANTQSSSGNDDNVVDGDYREV